MSQEAVPMQSASFRTGVKETMTRTGRETPMIDAVPMIPQPPTPGTLEYGDIPETSGVYAVFHGQECLYVGQSKNMRRRWQYHEQKTTFRRISSAVTLAWIVAPVSDLQALKRRPVETLLPRLNRNLKPWVPPKRAGVIPIATVAEVAGRLRVTTKTVRTWITDRQLTAIRVGREWRIREEDVQAFIQRHLSTATLDIHGHGD
jgi:excisionase family DNA binding protein